MPVSYILRLEDDFNTAHNGGQRRVLVTIRSTGGTYCRVVAFACRSDCEVVSLYINLQFLDFCLIQKFLGEVISHANVVKTQVGVGGEESGRSRIGVEVSTIA